MFCGYESFHPLVRSNPELISGLAHFPSAFMCFWYSGVQSVQNITCSMSRRGDCWDNAAIESFFSTLKLERVNRRRYATRDEARADLFDYIERFYNPRRKHSTLGNVSPAEFERRFGS